MYLPSQFAETRAEILHALMARHPLATLITAGSEGLLADHLPMMFSSQAAGPGLLTGHVARANPVWRDHRSDQEVLAIFQGPEAYITPSYYPEKAASGKVVPTWDYAVVHARGTLRFIHDRDWLHGLVTRLTQAHEAPRAIPWQVGDAPPDYIDKMLTAIVGFELSIRSLTGKWKISQNRAVADQRGVIDGLRMDGTPGGSAIADLLAERQ